MKNTFRKGLALLMAVCLLVPLFGISVLAENAEDLPIDYQFKDVEVPDNNGAQALSAGMTNDPYSSQQWNLEMIGMGQAWQSGLTGKGVRVAVIDTGVYTNTNDFGDGRLEAGKNLVTETASTNDTRGHGTFVAGLIGAEKDNGVGIAGVAPGVTIVPIKTSNDGSTADGVSAQAIRAAVDEFHCDVINYSSGSKALMSGVKDAVNYAVSKGTIVVCSTGNDGNTSLYYPGALEATIGVGSVDKSMVRSSFSHNNRSIFVVAPGEDSTSLGLGSGSVRTASGTSYSAPLVAGLAALLKEAHPEMNTNDFKAILQSSCKDLGEAGYDYEYGWGLIQAPEAIKAAATYFGTEVPDIPDTPEMEPEPEPGEGWTIWELFNFDWLREFFQNIIRSLFKGWSPNLTF